MLVYSFFPQQRCTALPHHFHPVLSFHFQSQQCSPILVHTLVAAFWPTAASHNFGPHLCPTNLAHCFVPAFLSTALLQRFCSMRGWPYGSREGLKPLDTSIKTEGFARPVSKSQKTLLGQRKTRPKTLADSFGIAAWHLPSPKGRLRKHARKHPSSVVDNTGPVP